MQNMNKKTVQGQSFVDKTLELTGSVEGLVKMAVLNNVSITDDIFIGDSFLASNIIKSTIVNGLKLNIPATKISSDLDSLIPEDLGIGLMIIEKTFIVR